MIIAFVIRHVATHRSQKLLKSVAEGVSTLSLDSSEVLKLERMDSRDCSKTLNAMKAIVSTVRYYRSYLPSVLRGSSAGEGGDGLLEGDETTTDGGGGGGDGIIGREKREEGMEEGMGSSMKQPSSGGGGSGSGRARSSGGSADSTSSAQHAQVGGSDDTSRSSISLETRQVTYVVIELTNFDDIVNLQLRFNSRLISEWRQAVIETIQEAAVSFRGTLHHFSEGTFVCSWNAVKRCVRHLRKAVQASLQIVDRLENKLRHHQWRMNVAVTVTSGLCCVGTSGTADFRRFDLLGPPCSMSRRIRQFLASRRSNNRRRGGGGGGGGTTTITLPVGEGSEGKRRSKSQSMGGVIVEGDCILELKYWFKDEIIGLVDIPSPSSTILSRPILLHRIFGVIERPAVVGIEWHEELAVESFQNDGFRDSIESGWALLMAGDVEGARGRALQTEEEVRGQQEGQERDELEEAIEDQNRQLRYLVAACEEFSSREE